MKDYLMQNIEQDPGHSFPSISATVNICIEAETDMTAEKNSFKDITMNDFIATNSDESFQSDAYFSVLENVIRDIISRQSSNDRLHRRESRF